MYPNGEMAIAIADFFEIPVDGLMKGFFPSDVKKSVQEKVAALKKKNGFNLLSAKIDLFDGSAEVEKSPDAAEATPGGEKLMKLYDKLNDEGQEKLIDYADDLVSSGKYIKTDQACLAQENA